MLVVPAPAALVAASYSLLPELLTAEVLASDVLVAIDPRHPSRPLGAAAFLPTLHDEQLPGFRGLVRVLPAWRRRGIGRALAHELSRHAAQWGVAWLHAWDAHSPGPEASFLQSTGFDACLSVHHFVGDIETALAMSSARVELMRVRGRIPRSVAVVSLVEVPIASILGLYRSQMGFASHEEIASNLQQQDCRADSTAVLDGDRLLGFLLTRPGGDLPAADLWIVDSAERNGWAAALVLQATLQRMAQRGARGVRFHCNDRALATQNFARRIGARLESTRVGYARALNRGTM